MASIPPRRRRSSEFSAKSVRYVSTQPIHTRAGVPPLARACVEALTKAGKQVILQIWWGPGGAFPWSKYSFANLALDERIRTDFWREVGMTASTSMVLRSRFCHGILALGQPGNSLISYSPFIKILHSVRKVQAGLAAG